MKELLLSLMPLFSMMTLLVAAGLFVAISAPGRGIVKLLLVPLTLAAALASPVYMARMLGHAVSWPLPDEFTFLAYKPVVSGGVKTAMEIWLNEGHSTRLHRAPYSKELEKMLEDAKKGQQGGREARIKKRGKGKPGHGYQLDPRGEYELKLESPSDLPKDIPGMPPGTPSQPQPAEPEPLTRRYSV